MGDRATYLTQSSKETTMGKNASGSDNRHDAEILRQAEAFKAAKRADDQAAAEAAAEAIRAEVAQANREHGG